ncbi:MAG: hypothetical protein H6Q39_546 [Chloroflexi bacterium]|jgi:hypothetical protein|nr:hypothetical protein [Chloroflexota bacterium]
MNKKRVFTDKELKEMGARTLDLVLAAIDAGDKEKAKELAQRMYREFTYLHDGYGIWASGLLTFIYKNYGIDAVEKAEREAHTTEAKVVFKAPQKRDARSLMEHMLTGMRGHLQPIEVQEDDEKFTITMKPCGSGDRIIQRGAYEAGLARVKEPHCITWGMKDFPIYCVHCPVMEMLDIERGGDFVSVHDVQEPLGRGECHFVFYKDPAQIPEKYYTRIGKKKPAPKK